MIVKLERTELQNSHKTLTTKQRIHLKKYSTYLEDSNAHPFPPTIVLLREDLTDMLSWD